ncbi:MAG: hypothetical protein E6Q97_33780 [Desulfurellales bacterium]|nr:MAG: hypothetical protein E6Q97_33780 [Desulfurellales bacterium]
MELSIETITPKQAEKYLQFNTSNRNIRKALVGQYARDMANGKWKLTHQGLAFNCDGTLLDGQHRLRAIVESGVTVQMLVARGVNSEHQLVMDDHAKRSAGDALTLLRGERVTAEQVAIVGAAVELQERAYAQHQTKAELNELINAFGNALRFTEQFTSTKQRGVTSAPVLAALTLAWFYVEDLDRLALFCRILCGVDMATEEADRSAQLLREWSLRTGVRYATQRTEAFRKSQRAIVSFMKYQKLERLHGTEVHYPWPLVDPIRK